jgi:hypothetical protein
MINSELGHVTTLEEFYDSIRSQQEEAHGDDYCAMHDAIAEIAKECTSYKELGTHQGGTLACALLQPTLKYVEGVDIDMHRYEKFLKPIAEQYAKDNKKVLKMKEVDSTGIDSLGYSTDILMIDSYHKAFHMQKELERHGQYTKKYIVAHDTHKPDTQLYDCLYNWGRKNGWSVMTRNTNNVGFTVLKKDG